MSLLGRSRGRLGFRRAGLPFLLAWPRAEGAGPVLSLKKGSKSSKLLLVRKGQAGLTCHLVRQLLPKLELCVKWVGPCVC